MAGVERLGGRAGREEQGAKLGTITTGNERGVGRIGTDGNTGLARGIFAQLCPVDNANMRISSTRIWM